MPVYERTYQTWDGARTTIFHRIMSFSKYTYLQVKGNRLVGRIFLMSFLPFILYLSYMYIIVNVEILVKMNIPIQSILPVNKQFFMRFLITQLPFLFFFTLAVGSNLISKDIHHKALPMILSKPINRWEYILGKFMVLFLLLSLLSWFLCSILFILQTALVSPESGWRQNFWSETFWILPQIIIFSCVVIFTMTLLMLFFSSITSNARMSGIFFIIFVIGSSVIAGILEELFNSNSWEIISPVLSVTMIGEYIFGLKHFHFGPWIYLISLWGICLIFLNSKVKAFQLYRE